MAKSNKTKTASLQRKPAGSRPPFVVKLTGPQRESLIHATRLKPAIKKNIEEAPVGTHSFKFTKKELDHLNEEVATAAVYAPPPDKKRLAAVQNKVLQLLDEEQAGASGGRSSSRQRRPSLETDVVFQFKITLLDIKPAIWRRIQVIDGNLGDLHECIQAAFGWWNYHLHQFQVAGDVYGLPDPDGMDFGRETIDETTVSLSQLLPKSGKRARWIYEYDFGDGWKHEVLFEGYPPADVRQKYPVCLEGSRACPPEDVGGPWGYKEYLAAMADPTHEEHAGFMEWRGPFDPEKFDPVKATSAMRSAKRA